MPTSGPSLRSVGIFGRVPRACCRIRERAILPQDIEVLCLQRCYILIQAGRILDCATASQARFLIDGVPFSFCFCMIFTKQGSVLRGTTKLLLDLPRNCFFSCFSLRIEPTSRNVP